MKETLFGGYIARNHVGSRLSDSELEVIKSGDVDKIIESFFKFKDDRYILQMQCMVKSMLIYFGDNITVEHVVEKKSLEGQFVACQYMDGDTDVFFGVSGDETALLMMASDYAMEKFEEFDLDAYDSLCELINCINGSFATKLSMNDIEVVLRPPLFYDDKIISCDNGMYVATLSYKGKKFNMILALDDKIDIR